MKYHSLAYTLALLLAAASSGFAQQNNHAVFIMTNSAFHNEIVTYNRLDNGSLQQAGRFSTHGRGSGGQIDPLSSQGSLVLSQDAAFLYAVNAGSGTVSIFRVQGSTLALQDVQPTFGVEPNAITQHGDLLYVANAGAASSVVGFHIQEDGRLEFIPNSLRFLSGNGAAPGGIAISPDGEFLAVTEHANNNIDVFKIQGDGTLAPIVVNHDATPGTFSVIFAPDGALLVTETGPSSGTNASATSSFFIESDGTLADVTAGLPTLGAGACWNVITPTGKFVYVSNSASSTLAGFSVGSGGALTPLSGTIVAKNAAGSTNLDIAVSNDGRFLYTLNVGAGTITVFAIQSNGSLTAQNMVTGLTAAAGLNGIAAY
ncbi:MAG: beta-propeller fold lactonase family protein [Bryobacteraceae bacterium]